MEVKQEEKPSQTPEPKLITTMLCYLVYDSIIRQYLKKAIGIDEVTQGLCVGKEKRALQHLITSFQNLQFCLVLYLTNQMLIY